MKIVQNKKTFLFLLLLSLFFNFLPSVAKSNFKSPVLNPSDLAFNGPIRSIVKDEKTGIVYVGGSFTRVGKDSGFGVPIEISTGKSQATFPKVNGEIKAVLSDGSGGWYIGGDFTLVGEVTKNHLAHILSNGTVDKNWNPDVDGTVNALVKKRTTIYIGGRFNRIGEIERNSLAAIKTDGTLEDWSPTVDGSINALAIQGLTLYIGGDFRHINGEERISLAAIRTNGKVTDWNPNAQSYPIYITTIKTGGSTVYIGGFFDKVGKAKRNHLAAIGIDGTIKNWNPNIGKYQDIYALEVDGSTVYVGGGFSGGRASALDCLAAVGTDGTVKDWNPDISGIVYTLVKEGHTIYVGGDLKIGKEQQVGEKTKKRGLVAVGTNGTVKDYGASIGEGIHSIAISGSKIFIGGPYSIVIGKQRDGLAAIGTDGILEDWSPAVDGSVSALAIKDSTIYVGGKFGNINNTARGNLAAIGTDGTLLKDWNPNVRHDDSPWVYALEIDGPTIYVGGMFTTVEGKERNNLAAIGTDGTLKDWNPNVTGKNLELHGEDGITRQVEGSSINALIFNDSTIYAGGDFTKIGGIERNNLAAIRTDGTLKDWNPNVNATGTVNALALDNSTVYIGGGFTKIGEIQRNGLVAIGIDSTLKDWNPNIAVTSVERGFVTALAISGPTIYIGGNFRDVNGKERNGLAAIGTDGTLKDWNPNLRPYEELNSLVRHVYNPVVHALEIDGSTVYVGGGFTSIGDEVRSIFASFSIPEED